MQWGKNLELCLSHQNPVNCSGLKREMIKRTKGSKYPSGNIWQSLDGRTRFSSLGKHIVDDLKVGRIVVFISFLICRGEVAQLTSSQKTQKSGDK